MNEPHKSSSRAAVNQSQSLPVLPNRPVRVKRSTMAKWRAGVLVLVHLAIFAHVIQWWVTGRTLSPVEPSEAMYTLNEGLLNAGFVFFALSLIITLIFGRFVCGWGCHFIAYQDLCSWLLKRVGIKPRPIRSRLLAFGPLVLAIYMFVWPTAYRLWMDIPAPKISNHLMTTEFWKTFPGPVTAVLSVLICGVGIVYFLGSKGFCTYACPYGGFYGLADKAAVWRIRVTDACAHCGHCTATCTSNVRVHDEVARYGMVVDPGCMKCMDCVTVCPNDALYVGFGRPAIGAKPVAPRAAVRSEFTWALELGMAGVAIASFLAFRGLYGRIPMLLAMGLAVMTVFLAGKLWALARSPNVRWQNLQLKKGRRLTRPGTLVALLGGGWLMLTVHSAAVQYSGWQGARTTRSLALSDEVWLAGPSWLDGATDGEQKTLKAGLVMLERADRWGLATSPPVLTHLVWLYLAEGRLDAAEQAVRRIIELTPTRPEPYRSLATIHRKAGRIEAAQQSYLRSIEADPAFPAARADYVGLLLAADEVAWAIDQLREARAAMPDDSRWAFQLGSLFLQRGRLDEAGEIAQELLAADAKDARALVLLGVVQTRLGHTGEALASLQRAIELSPEMANAHYHMGMLQLQASGAADAIGHLERAIALNPSQADYHYNLGVAIFMTGRPAGAMPHIKRSLELKPDDPVAQGFLRVVRIAIDKKNEHGDDN